MVYDLVYDLAPYFNMVSIADEVRKVVQICQDVMMNEYNLKFLRQIGLASQIRADGSTKATKVIIGFNHVIRVYVDKSSIVSQTLFLSIQFNPNMETYKISTLTPPPDEHQ